MPQNNAETDNHTILFASLLTMLSTTALHQMGKLVDPETGKAESHLDAAQVTIDMIEMLKARTGGNLTPDEEALLTQTLSSLQMTFVETRRSAPAETPAGKPEAPAAEPAAAPAEPPQAGDTAKKPDAREPKYHKSYGS